jgi:lipid II:glycine glycyltransferase (peptidoglycan interpeptide bridge formation enzyme)
MIKLSLFNNDIATNLFSYQNKTSLFQSDLWAELHRELNYSKVYKINSFQVFETDKLIYIGGITKNQLNDDFYFLSDTVKSVIKFNNKNRCIALDFQIYTQDEIVTDLHALLLNLGLSPSNLYWIPRQRCLVDLSKELNDIIANYYNKTQNDIKRAQKKYLKIIESWDVNEFYSMYMKTAQKHSFKCYNLEYFQVLCKFLKRDIAGKLFFASKDHYPMMVAALVCEYNKILYYLYTGSRTEFNFLNPSSFLQHFIIEYAKNKDCNFYDMMGVRCNINFGPTRFKLKFGTYVLRLMSTYIKKI